MATVSAFGYSVPLTVVLVFVALVVGLGLAVLFWLTVGMSVYRSVGDTRRQRVRDDLQTEFLNRLFDPDAGWGGWVDGLSGLERTVVESLLDEYLRELDGQHAEDLRELGDELGIPERCERRLGGREEYDRLHALTWLTLLRRPGRVRAAGFSPQTPRERAAVVRLRYESDDLETPGEGISLLLEGSTGQFTVFGQDTLYRVAVEDPGALFETAAATHRTWSEPLLVQVLVVCQHLGTSVTTEDLSWLTATLEHESVAVRAAAVRALANLGWRGDIRNDRFVDRVLADPSPQVRSAGYRMLAQWGDEHALAALARGLRAEPDARARLAGTDALVGRREEYGGAVPEPLADAWAWSREHAAYDRTARQRGKQVSG